MAHDENLSKLWALIEADLWKARNILPSSAATDPTIQQFHEYLDHNELELACDALEYYAEDKVLSREFWLALRDAAKKMQLREKSSRYENCAAKA